MDILGFKIGKPKEEEKKLDSFSPPLYDDGALTVESLPDVGAVTYKLQQDIDGAAKTDAELITKYRDMSLYPEVEAAVDDIVNEVITNDPGEEQVKILLDKVETPDAVKKAIETEFSNVLKMLTFKQNGYEVFKRWYVDGRIYYHMVIDPAAPNDGIKELRYIDPRKIKKVRETQKKKRGHNNKVDQLEVKSEFYVYNEMGFAPSKSNLTPAMDIKGLKISPDSIAYVTSGLMNPDNTIALSYLHKAIKPLNQLKSMEDSLVIYRIARAPERRIFYIDVGTLPTAKAEQHIKNMMTKFKNRIQYDQTTGEIRDDRKFMSPLEDFWLSRRGEKGTEIDTLPGGQSLGEITDVNYFQQKLYAALNVPKSRLNAESDGFNMGRSTEISRDELKFQKFINRLRLKFQTLFTIILGKQLVLKGIVNSDEWKIFVQDIDFQFSEDNYFSELKEAEIERERLSLLQEYNLSGVVGKYVSHETVRKKVLRQSEEDMKDEDKKIKEELKNEVLNPPDPELEGQNTKPINNKE